ncbi:uncharacterized protein EHS24_006322 [Apiotrichum porosum]|uniref:Uncharacterized protein n=1 Tax=Apiotrichum porosum TaxID=105984 RepID=A0A427Y0X9_9TREE|nr:uncharacterized protein EHS24_006322 [Apiotrichum porosum]RSH84796.1 hypothetical protein EHS24_006322 [Apiotrichum porosum]
MSKPELKKLCAALGISVSLGTRSATVDILAQRLADFHAGGAPPLSRKVKGAWRADVQAMYSPGLPSTSASSSHNLVSIPSPNALHLDLGPSADHISLHQMGLLDSDINEQNNARDNPHSSS